MKKYVVAERILRCKFPYGGRNEIHDGYVIIDSDTGNPVSELIKNKEEANHKACEWNNEVKT